MKILFLVTEDWYFWSHRLSVARSAHAAGAKVLVMSHLSWLREMLEAEGFKVIESHVSRGNWNREGFFNAAPIWQKWTEHLSGQRNWQHHLWGILMFQAWLEANESA